MYIYTNITVKKKVKSKACLHSIYWTKFHDSISLKFFPLLVVIGQRLRKLCVSYFISRKTCPIYSFLYEYTCFEDGDVHFIAFPMWWIRECQEGQFIPCNTAQLIAKCLPKMPVIFWWKKAKTKIFSLC